MACLKSEKIICESKEVKGKKGGVGGLVGEKVNETRGKAKEKMEEAMAPRR